MGDPRLLLSCAVLLLVVPYSFGHHTGAIFDDKKSTTLSGTVKAFQWTNPHCWIQLIVAGEQGSAEWSVEMGSPSQLFHGGWKPKSVQPGDKITVVVHPMRDGTTAGLFMSATFADGRAITAQP